MLHSSFNSQLNFFQKIKNFDYILIICILLLGLISCLSMYSTDQGQVLFHTKSHVLKFLIFFFDDDFVVIFEYKILALLGLFVLCYCFIFLILGFFVWH